MNPRIIWLCTAMLFASPLLAREKTDVIVMKNGNRITCEIKSLRSNTLYVNVAYILPRTVSLNWSEVDQIESKQLFIVKTQDGAVYTGAVSIPENPDGRPVQIEILEAPEKKAAVEKTRVVDMRETSDNFWQRLDGQIGTGFTYSKGNQSTQYNVNSDVNYSKERWSAGANYSSNFTSNSRSSTSTRNNISATGQRLLRWNNWYYTGVADFLQSSVQGIQLQSTFGGGIGRNIKNSGGTYFTVYGGFAFQQINYQETGLPTHSQQVSSALIGTNLKLFQFNKTTVAVSGILLPAISEPGRLHFNLNSSYYVKLWGKLNWNFTFYGSWDNHPPPHFSSSDYGTSSGLSLNFGNR